MVDPEHSFSSLPCGNGYEKSGVNSVLTSVCVITHFELISTKDHKIALVASVKDTLIK